LLAGLLFHRRFERASVITSVTASAIRQHPFANSRMHAIVPSSDLVHSSPAACDAKDQCVLDPCETDAGTQLVPTIDASNREIFDRPNNF